MTGRRSRSLALLLTLGLAVVAGGCSDDDDEDSAVDRASTSSTSSTAAAGDDSTTTPTAAGDAGATTTGGNGSPTSAPPAAGAADAGDGVIELTINGGKVDGGVRRVQVKQGAQVTIRVTSDVAEELHVHTYDLKLDLVPGQSADLTFLAKTSGVIEVELEQRRKKVLELEVRP